MRAALAASLGLLSALAAPPSGPASPPTKLSIALQQAGRGDCAPAVPVLRHALARMPPDEQLSAARLLADCGMSLHNDAITDQALNFLNQHFPDNPRVLYITSHFYSQMANRAAHRLLGTAPHSAPAQEMLAEAMEARGQWPQAEAAYRRLLRDHPAEPGIHYQLGRIILTRPFSAQVAAAAKHQFEAELKLDPHSSSTYFMLGELALRTRAWPEAIRDFQRSVGDNAAFTEADLGLGMALNGAGRYRAAVAPLRRYVAATPKDAAGHYQLALALGRSGHLAAAQREMAEVRRLAAAGRRPGANAAENQAQPH